MRLAIIGDKKVQRPIRKHDTETEGLSAWQALIHIDTPMRECALQQIGQIQTRRSGTNDRDLHVPEFIKWACLQMDLEP